MRTIEREELKKKIDRGDDFRLVMTLGGWAFRAAHIPGSLHFDSPEAAFAALEPGDEIVVYCSNPACIASRYAYEQFVEHGYQNVRRFSGGLEEWSAAGYPLEGEGVGS
jgi:rhodanese-related sulfurtransferase